MDASPVNGAKPEDHNLICFVEESLDYALRLDGYIADAERAGDPQLAEFFKRAQAASRRSAERGEDELRIRIARWMNQRDRSSLAG